MEMDEIERNVTSRRERKEERQRAGDKTVLPSISMAGRTTVGELREHEHAPTKTGSWRVRLTELIPRSCLPSYLGIRGTAADPGLLLEPQGGSRLPTGVPAFKTMRFESPLPPGSAVCAEWRVSADGQEKQPEMTSGSSPATPVPSAIAVDEILDDSTDDDTDISSIAVAYGLDGIASGITGGGVSFADSREVFFSAKDWDEIADDLIAAEEEFSRTPEAKSENGEKAFADFLDKKFGQDGTKNIKRLLSGYFKSSATDVSDMVIKPTGGLVKDLGKGMKKAGDDVGKGMKKAGDEMKKMTLNNPVKDGINSIISKAQNSARGGSSSARDS